MRIGELFQLQMVRRSMHRAVQQLRMLLHCMFLGEPFFLHEHLQQCAKQAVVCSGLLIVHLDRQQLDLQVEVQYSVVWLLPYRLLHPF